MARILQFPKKYDFYSSKNTFPPIKIKQFSDVLGGNKDNFKSRVCAYAFCEIMDWGIDLTQFSDEDYTYSPKFDVVFVKISSPLYTWIALR